jgi:SOS-response transcriptional repressor LexA
MRAGRGAVRERPAAGALELKNAADEEATIWTAFQQLQTYQAEIPSLFAPNAVLVVSDGVEARVGTLTAGREWFKPWRTIGGETLAPDAMPQLRVVIEGMFARRRFLDLVRDFIVFENEGGGRLVKKMAGYHQFHAVQVAVAETLRAAELRVAAEAPARPMLTIVRPDPQERYRTCVPLVPLKAAAGVFGDPQHVPDEGLDWVAVQTRRRLRRGMFVARVEGRSMEPTIPDGALCLFSAPVEGTRQGKTVLVQLRDAVDPETGQRYTVKRYESEKAPAGDSWRHTRITLKPLNPEFPAIALSPDEADRLQVVAELVEVLADAPRDHSKVGDRRVGVVWHTQGSGKSLTMAFYAGRIIREPAMENPTLVVLTDRNDLDDQLFGTFSRCQDLLRQPPVQAESRAHLRQLLSVAAGGVVFTTIHKFFPEEKGDRHPTLSERRNIVVIADEAHRSQYDFIDGFARHMRDALPHASFIGFTGTPIELADANTRAVFGDYISVYDIQRAVQDGATVPISPLPRPQRRFQARPRARHVADRVRCAVAAHDVRGQTHAWPRADAGDRPAQPRLPRQTRRAGRRLPGSRPRAEGGARHLHREWRHWPHGARPGRGGRPDAGEVRSLLRPLPRVRPGEVGERHAPGAAGAPPRRAGAHPSPGKR